MEISKKDWKLFRERISGWQEAYMQKLTEEYIALLSKNEDASEKFWELDKRIKDDRRKPGVQLRLDKKNVDIDLVRLIQDEAITLDDLDGFSEELKMRVKTLLQGFML
ncbi:MAG: hypothetical protein ACOX4R_05740 [Lentihominibacter sp.]|jgi:hypothetical protein